MTLYQTFRLISPYGVAQKAVVVVTALIIGLVIGNEHWLLLVTFAVLVAVFLRPVQVALGLFAFAIPFDSIAAAGHARTGTTVTMFIGATTAAVLLTVGYLDGRLQRPSRAAQLWMVFLIWSIITTLWAVNLQTSLGRMPTALSFLLLCFVTLSFRIKSEEFELTALMTILGGLAAAVVTLYQYHNGVFFAGAQLSRGSLVLGGRESNPNIFAIGLLVPLSLAICWFFRTSRTFVKVAMVAFVAITLFAILVTLSRGALFAVCALIAVYLYRLRVNWRLTTLIAVLWAGLLMAVPGAFFTRVETAFSDRGAGRLDIWEAGLVAFKHYMLIGAGLDNFPVVYTDYAGYATHFWGYRDDPHNLFLGIAVEFGVVGLLLFITAISYQLHEAARARVRHGERDYSVVACEAGCCGVLVAGFFAQVLWLKAFWLSWILLAFATQLLKSSSVNEPLQRRQNPSDRNFPIAIGYFSTGEGSEALASTQTRFRSQAVPR